MSGSNSPQRQCPNCGFIPSNDENPPALVYRPWHIRGRAAVRSYVASLTEEAHEWLMALFVDDELSLLAVDTIARGDVSSCKVNFARILCRGHALKAAGFILVHNHPSGDPTPSSDDIKVTSRLRRASVDLELPLLDHLIIAGEHMMSVGGF